MHKSLINLLGIFAISMAIVACGKKETPGPTGQARQMNTPQVDGFIVRPQSIIDKIEVPGSLLPGEQTQIRAEVSGRVVQLNIKEGTLVQKGALLVKLFDGDLQNQLKKTQSSAGDCRSNGKPSG